MSHKQFDKTGLRVLPPVDQPAADMQHRARLFVASQATDATDCAELLAMLGLAPTPDEIAAHQSITSTP